MARAGLGSRRTCEEMISRGRVTVNGRIARLGTRVNCEADEVRVDGSQLPISQDLRYVLLNKPVGVVSTASDPEGRPTVVDLVPEDERLFPVGRLDMATEGLILLTNDGRLANALMHPAARVEKTYVVEVAGRLEPGALRSLRRGVQLEDGMTLPAKAAILAEAPGRLLLELKIREGRNRQIRRMIEAVGGRVAELTRVAIGPIRDRSLKPGRWRALRPGEVAELYRVSGESVD